MWIKLSGASPKLLEKTGEFAEKEKIKYSRYGKLVLVPAILGGIAGYYAFSTIFDNTSVAIALGVLWFFIVLAVDMALSATMYKSKHDNPVGFWITVSFRIAFAICVGLVVSHPLVLRIFEPSIIKNIAQRDNDKKAQDVLAATATVETAKQTYQLRIDSKNRTNQCLINVVQFETSKDNTYARDFYDTNNVLCGSSSGKGAGCSIECVRRKELIENNKKEIVKIETELNNAIAPQKSLLTQAESNRTIPVVQDYLERTEALDVLMNGDGNKLKAHPHVSLAAKTLICFFVVLDILIVMFKATTPMGAYEHTMDSYMDRHIGLLEAKKIVDIRYASESEDIMRKIQLKALTAREASELFSAVVVKLEEEFENFENIEKKWLKRAGFFNAKKKQQIKRELHELRKSYEFARTTTINSLASVLGELRDSENATRFDGEKSNES